MKSNVVVANKRTNGRSDGNSQNERHYAESETAEAAGPHVSMHLLDTENSKLRKEFRSLAWEYKSCKEEHERRLQQLEEERRVAALNARISKNREDEKIVQRWRNMNIDLRRDVMGKERLRDALQQNIKLMAASNAEAKSAISNAKTAHIKSFVRHHRLSRECTNVLEEVEVQESKLTTRHNLLDAEDDVRDVYLKAMKKLVKMVQKRLTDDDDGEDSKLKADVTRVVRLYISTESRRGGKSNLMDPPGHTHHLDDSFQSATSATERCDDEW
jgi:hypothetical protein